MIPTETFFAYWSNHTEKFSHTYWVHDAETCRLAAALEGHVLFRRTDGDNANAYCHVCRVSLACEAPTYETERS